MLIKSALRDLLSVPYGKITILLTGSLRSPPLWWLRHHLSPASGGTTNRAKLRVTYEKIASRSFVLPPNCGGSPAQRARGMLFSRPQGGCMVFAAKGGIYTGAPKGAHLASAAILYNSRGRKPSTRPGGVSRSRTEPLAPRAKGPAAPSTLAAKPRQPTGILESTAPPTGIYREMIHYRRIPRSFVSLSILVICQVFFLKKFIVFS